MPAQPYHPLVLTPTSYSRTSARPVCSGRALYAPRARGLGEMCGRNFFSKGWYFAKDCEVYDSCACCSDKNRNLDVAGVLWERFDLAARLFSSRGNVDEDFPAREGQSGESVENGVTRKRREEKGRKGQEGMNEREKVREAKERRQIITYIRVISDSRNIAQLLVGSRISQVIFLPRAIRDIPSVLCFPRLYCYPPPAERACGALVETIRSLNPSVSIRERSLATDLTFLCALVGPSHSSSVAKNRASLRSTVLSDPTSLRKLLSQGFLHPPLTKPRT
ncbi:hypothetical protein ALC57_03514 [Trachymyrmex cornetzi]|uniref:Uncharacterized protein n=1 Tax=Trachymyrmex cornetzi TaxID=471704 RepID=A0A195EG91_9HYME|nr:hypothetical protein ALC57_03514 [Trachymyrmex cornetzi]